MSEADQGEPAPVGFVFDHDRLLLVVAEALRTEAGEDAFQALVDDRLIVLGELDERGVPVATVSWAETGERFARMGLRWGDVGDVPDA